MTLQFEEPAALVEQVVLRTGSKKGDPEHPTGLQLRLW